MSGIFESILLGATRGIVVDTVLHPLEVVKARQQCAEKSENSLRIAARVLRQDGIRAFYNGLGAQLTKNVVRQPWRWPMITRLPPYLKSRGIEDVYQQLVITGGSISAVDTFSTAPLERIKIRLSVAKEAAFSWATAYSGSSVYFTKRAVSWVSFLTIQKYLRDRASFETKGPLSFQQLATIEVQTAFAVSVISAPIDYATTRKMADNISPSSLLTRGGMAKLFRGAPLNFLSLSVHNIASVALIAKMEEKR